MHCHIPRPQVPASLHPHPTFPHSPSTLYTGVAFQVYSLAVRRPYWIHVISNKAVAARSQVNNGRVASTRSNSNGPIGVEAETILRVSVVDYPVTSL